MFAGEAPVHACWLRATGYIGRGQERAPAWALVCAREKPPFCRLSREARESGESGTAV